MPKTFDIHVRVPLELMQPLLALCTDDKRVTVLHIGQTQDAPAPSSRNGRDPSSEPYTRKLAVPLMAKLRTLATEGVNATHGVFYKDLGDILYKENVIGSPSSVTAILSALYRAGKIKKVSRGRYLPV